MEGEAAVSALEAASFSDGGKVLAIKAAILSIPQEAPAMSEEQSGNNDSAEGHQYDDADEDSQEMAAHDE